MLKPDFCFGSVAAVENLLPNGHYAPARMLRCFSCGGEKLRRSGAVHGACGAVNALFPADSALRAGDRVRLGGENYTVTQVRAAQTPIGISHLEASLE